jgi:hypothetical protein
MPAPPSAVHGRPGRYASQAPSATSATDDRIAASSAQPFHRWIVCSRPIRNGKPGVYMWPEKPVSGSL